MTRFVYADNAATTQISPEVLEAMMPWLTDGYGNASSIYKKGVRPASLWRMPAIKWKKPWGFPRPGLTIR